jgi:hypothetical protein
LASKFLRIEFSFCESASATSSTPWHIRKLTKEGLKVTGGVDTNSLCGRVQSPLGWDVDVDLSRFEADGRLEAVGCERCVREYRRLKGGALEVEGR